jgi:signal transduction histidine kinase
MTEMRSMLGSLRNTEAGRQLGPQPNLADLPRLFASARSGGVRIAEPDLSGVEHHDIGEVIALTAYRIVQEALSNVIRHAPGATVHVDFTVSGGSLGISVINTSSAVGAVMAQLDKGSHVGQGLIGMRERADIVGGSVVCRPTPDGGFSVTAQLPLEAAKNGAGKVTKTMEGSAQP